MSRDCEECNDPLGDNPPNGKKYCCRACLVRARNRRNRPTSNSMNHYAAADAALNAIQIPKRAKLSRLRYATLAATPDVPAAQADRGEQLTGGAGAVSYAQSVRLVGVGI